MEGGDLDALAAVDFASLPPQAFPWAGNPVEAPLGVARAALTALRAAAMTAAAAVGARAPKEAAAATAVREASVAAAVLGARRWMRMSIL